MSLASAKAAGGSAAGEVTHARVLAIAVPMTLAYLSTPLLGFVDTTVIGRLGSAPLLGGIAVGAIIFNVLFTVFNFLRMGTTGLTAQAAGAGDRREVAALLHRALLIALATGLGLVVLQAPLLAGSLAFMGASTAVAEATATYFEIRILGAPVALANYAVLGWFLGQARAGTGLLLQTLLNGANIVFSIWFVMGLGWGIAGAAWATVIGEATALAAGLALVARLYGREALVPAATVFDRAAFVRLVTLNRDILVRSAALLFAFAFFTAQSARQTDLVLAANAVLMNFLMVAGYFLDGFATAAEQLVGTAIGRRSRAMALRSVRLTVGWGVGLGAVTSLALLLLGPVIIDFVTTSEPVRAAARVFLVWAALTPVVGALAYEFDGVFIGATWSRDMRNMMLVSLAAGGLVWWLAVPAFGNHGLWLALWVFLAARGLTLLARFPACLGRAFPAS